MGPEQHLVRAHFAPLVRQNLYKSSSLCPINYGFSVMAGGFGVTLVTAPSNQLQLISFWNVVSVQLSAQGWPLWGSLSVQLSLLWSLIVNLTLLGLLGLQLCLLNYRVLQALHG